MFWYEMILTQATSRTPHDAASRRVPPVTARRRCGNHRPRRSITSLHLFLTAAGVAAVTIHIILLRRAKHRLGF